MLISINSDNKDDGKNDLIKRRLCSDVNSLRNAQNAFALYTNVISDTKIQNTAMNTI